jgi:acetolactate synthase-1/2/3 large subunit
MPNGAYALLRTLVDAGVDTCFTNPGTTEVHLVEALDSIPEMRTVLALFEGVATGAADGYARITDVPAATLLHLGPGLGNGLANLHNARRAKVPVVNIVGDQASHHVKHDAPPQSDIETIARNVSTWVRTTTNAAARPSDALEAIAVAAGPPCQVATLIVPADLTWQEGAEPAAALHPTAQPAVSEEMVAAAADAIRGSTRTGILLGGKALRGRGLIAAGRIAAATGGKLLAEFRAARLERGIGLPAVERLAYWPELAASQLDGLEHLILADASHPVSYFAYDGRDDSLVAPACTVHQLSPPTCDVVLSLEALATALDAADTEPALQQQSLPSRPEGPLTAAKICQAVGAIMPEHAIISEEAITSGAAFASNTVGAPRHDWLPLTGGAIGQGLPVAIGAAIAAPGRPVIALEGDGSALYTFQSLWTMAREQLNVTVIIANNRAYGILNEELARYGKSVGRKAGALLNLRDPPIDFVGLGSALGIPSHRVDTAEQLTSIAERAIADPGPHLIDAIMPIV